MTQTFETVFIAIGDLVDHPANVRINAKDTCEPENIAQLQAGIAALGLLQPILVQKQKSKYGVLAGRRRQAALNALVADKAAKDFTKKTKIECRLVPQDCDATTAISFAENYNQAPMNAIDEYEAFARMLQVDGQSVDTIALQFGTTVKAVKGRLRYGLIHPDIRDAARAKEISLDAMKAFAAHPSQEVQKEVFDTLTGGENRFLQSYAVHQALKNRGVQASDDLGEFVREEYEARGGAIAADLLEEHSVLEDAGLVEEILLEKLHAAAEKAKTKMGFAWSDAVITFDHGGMSDHGRVYPGPIEPDEAGQKRVDAITAELEELEAKMEDEGLDQDEYNALYDQVDALETEARDLQEAYSEEDLARSGVIASWSRGEVTLHVGFVRPEDKKTSAAPSVGTTGTTSEDRDEIVYPASLTADLKTERAMALGAAMVQHPEATLDLTLFKMVTDVLRSGTAVTYAIKVDVRQEYRNHAKMDEIDNTSLDQMGAAHDDLDLSWMDEARSPADQFAAFRSLDAAEKAKLVAYASATTTQLCFARDPERDSLMYAFEQEIIPDIREHWAPNAALFNRFKKVWLLKILAEDLGLVQEAATLASSSKKEIVAFCDKLFAEPFATLTDTQLAAVAAWCPPHMQTAGTEAEVDEDATEGDQTDDHAEQPINEDLAKAA